MPGVRLKNASSSLFGKNSQKSVVRNFLSDGDDSGECSETIDWIEGQEGRILQHAGRASDAHYTFIETTK